MDMMQRLLLYEGNSWLCFKMSKLGDVEIFGANAAEVHEEVVVFSTSVNAPTTFWVFGRNGRFLRRTLDQHEDDNKTQHSAASVIWEGCLFALNSAGNCLRFQRDNLNYHFY